ncbi:hypothetical protein CMI41_03210 [Candidatus Pacearchaeota archaeon]|nr:hypothetical protein [Candidatus Pacearchaeota archaeon]|tara:strand:+ start:672 stop:1772 length:1101 start_codon:yes stop_codon:yes gene_type:complete
MAIKEIGVHMQYPWKSSDSAYYKNLIDFPPRNVTYMNGKREIVTEKEKLWQNIRFKRFARNLIRSFYPSLPNAHLTKSSTKFNLIHCAHCLSLNKKPWVADIEFADQFWASINKKSSRRKILRILESSHCKKILPWSEWSKKNILERFPEIHEKVELVYPAMPIRKKKEEKSGPFKILFIGRDFKGKGGYVALKAIEDLTRRFKDIQGILIGDIPPGLLKKYKNSERIDLHQLVTQENLFELFYPSADVFLYPTFSDTLGFAILEAQSFGLPVIATKTASTHTVNETIANNKTGFIIEDKNVNLERREFSEAAIREMIKKIELLYLNKKLLKKMSKAAQKQFIDGKFSIKKRNEKLEKIYIGALED